MTRILRFGVAAVMTAAAASAQAGLFGFSTHRGCGHEDCCPEDCCPEECCPDDCCPDECGSNGCLHKKKGGLLGKLFGCFKKHKSDCCEVDCCEDGCCEDGCAPTYGVARPSTVHNTPAVQATPAKVAPAAPKATVAPAPPVDAAPAPPAEAAPAPPAPSEDAEAYFPSRMRKPASAAANRFGATN